MAKVQKSAEHRTRPPKKDPFRIGYRYDQNGKMIPLTEYDLLNPQEGDKVMQNDAHSSDVPYLRDVLRSRIEKRPNFRVFSDQGLDFSNPSVPVMSPDISIVEGEYRDWKPDTAVIPLLAINGIVHCVMEVPSRTTRRVDVEEKPVLLYRAGVPLYILIDTEFGGSKKPLGVRPYKAGPNGYEPLPLDDHGRYWIEMAEVSVGIKNGHVACFDRTGQFLGNYDQVTEQVEREKARADEEKARADAEKARAELAKATAEQEKSHREAAEARIRELEAQLKKPKRKKK